MYSHNGTYYNEEHSISFIKMDFAQRTFETVANTWTDWHLIPSSRPIVAQPAVTVKMVEIPGSDTPLDLTDYLAGKPQLGLRTGSFTFIIDNGHENVEEIRKKMVSKLHGKRLQMRLMDDPDYFYDGRFTVGNFESGETNTTVTIGYQLNPYKLTILYNQREFWISIGEEYRETITATDYLFRPVAVLEHGNVVTVTFAGSSKILIEDHPIAELALAEEGDNTLLVTGAGQLLIYWQGGSL